MDSLTSKVAAFALDRASNWWNEINDSTVWQDGIFHTLAALYGFVAAISLIQFVRIQCRVPLYRWTTQKVFLLLNFLVNGVRSIVFALRIHLQQIRPEVFQQVLLDLPSLAFFTIYSFLVLFWAEIYYQAKSQSTDVLRPSLYRINAVVYFIQMALWLFFWPIQTVLILSKIFFAGCCFFAALGFLLYGGRLSLMLQWFSIESEGKTRILQEVGYTTLICFSCFLVRFIMMYLNAFDKAVNLDALNHPILNFLYFSIVEILPSALVLYIFRSLPQKYITQYHPLH